MHILPFSKYIRKNGCYRSYQKFYAFHYHNYNRLRAHFLWSLLFYKKYLKNTRIYSQLCVIHAKAYRHVHAPAQTLIGKEVRVQAAVTLWVHKGNYRKSQLKLCGLTIRNLGGTLDIRQRTHNVSHFWQSLTILSSIKF